jgi:hypothetical protein
LTTLFATYCSAEKNTSSGMLAAVLRYRAPRITDLCAAAKTAGAQFGILSGMFGLIGSDEPIPWYEHLLLTTEVADMATRVQATLQRWEVDKIYWHTVGAKKDPNVARYLDVMRIAAGDLRIPVNVVLIDG